VVTTKLLSRGRWQRQHGALVWGDLGEPDFDLEWQLVRAGGASVEMWLGYRLAGEVTIDRVPIEVARTMPGGRFRFYFLCPRCLHRATRLYRPIVWYGSRLGRWFRCRRCHNLSYRSQLDE
jgi:hypothetical protein